MMPPGVKAVFFDAVGTLLVPEPPAADVYADVGRRHGSRLGLVEIARRFAAAFAREEEIDLAGALRTSEEREVRRWRNIVAAVLDDVADPASCFHALYDHFARPAAWRCRADAARVLSTLAQRGCALGLASNYDHRLRSVIAGSTELYPLKHVVISSEVGWRKPAPQFFAHIVKTVQLSVEQILLVGDDVDNAYAGARGAGLQALLLDPGGKHREIAARITDLAALV